MLNIKEALEFLKELQIEMLSQPNDGNADPVFWTVGDYKWQLSPEGNAERWVIYIPEHCESYEANEYIKSLKEDTEDLTEEAIDELNGVGCEDSLLDWVREYIDEDAEIYPEEKVHIIEPNTMFITKQDAINHIKSNYYHYTDEVHTYAMTAWRSPKVEKLYKVLKETDWESVLNKVGDDYL